MQISKTKASWIINLSPIYPKDYVKISKKTLASIFNEFCTFLSGVQVSEKKIIDNRINTLNWVYTILLFVCLKLPTILE